MMEFYELKQPDVVDAVAPLMSDGSRLVRSLAAERFYDSTRCPLMEQWSQGVEPSKEQVAAAQAWWREHRPAATPTGP
jgi:hypothetical protein